MLRLLLLALTLVLTPFIGAQSAAAGTYTVWSCTDALRQEAPTEGWTGTNGFGSGGSVGNTCASGGVLSAYFTGLQDTDYAASSVAGWTFTAPTDVVVERATIDTNWQIGNPGGDNAAYVMAGVSKVGLPNRFGRDDPSVVSNCSSCGQPVNGTTPFTTASRTIGFGVGCFGDNGTSGSCRGTPNGRGHVFLTRAELLLGENLPPTAGGFGGSALGGQPLSGTATLSFTAADRGSGVWQAEVRLGSKVLRPRSVVDGNGGRCTDAAATAGFRYPLPCKTSVGFTFDLDTTVVPDGTHELDVYLWDAAGNATTAIDRQVTVRNAPPAPSATPTPAPVPGATPMPGATPTPTATPIAPDGGGSRPGGPTPGPVGAVNGSGGDPGTARFATKPSKRPKTRAVGYGRKLELTDRLLDAKGKAIVGAAVDVIETRSGAPAQTVATVVTDAKGRFAHRVNTTGPRLVEFAYARTVGSTSYVDRRATKVRVRADVAFRISPARASRGKTVRFSGVVKAGPLPRRGVQLVIESRAARGWLPAKVIDVGSTGTFSWTYRFRNAGRYPFRARVLRSSGLEVEPGSSPTVDIRVR